MSVLLTGAFTLAEAGAVPGVAGNTWLFAGLLATWALYVLLAHGRKTQE